MLIPLLSHGWPEPFLTAPGKGRANPGQDALPLQDTQTHILRLETFNMQIYLTCAPLGCRKKLGYPEKITQTLENVQIPIDIVPSSLESIFFLINAVMKQH